MAAYRMDALSVCLLCSVTILFADVCGFTQFSRTMNPNDTFDMLNGLFASFESFLKWFPNIEKVRGLCRVVES